MKTLSVTDFINAQDSEREMNEALIAFKQAYHSKKFNKRMSRVFNLLKHNNKSNEPKTNR